jgi:hypothetical protein
MIFDECQQSLPKRQGLRKAVFGTAHAAVPGGGYSGSPAPYASRGAGSVVEKDHKLRLK